MANALTRANSSERIIVGSEIRFKVMGMSVKTNKFYVIGSINDNTIWNL